MEEEMEEKLELDEKDLPKLPLTQRFFNLSGRSFLLVLLCSLALSFLALPIKLIEFEAGSIEGYRLDSILTSFFACLIAVGVQFFIFYLLPETKKRTPMDKKRLSWMVILSFFGVLAGIVIQFLLIDYMCLSFHAGTPIALFVVCIYQIFTYCLTVQNKLESRDWLWEIYRFALVGAIAAVFDFTVTYLIRFGFEQTTVKTYISTFVAVAAGFTIGVIINYICSVTMVFMTNSKKSISKKASGIALFVGLSAVGLFIGIGLELLFYDLLKLPAVVSFLIRTFVVLIWNYISRKVFIFK